MIYLLPTADIFGIEEKPEKEKREELKKRLLEIAEKFGEVKNERKV